MSIVITVSNQKGGVGKTTTSVALCAGLAHRGAKVLGVDLDPQGNLGFCLGLEGNNGPTVLDALSGRMKVSKAIRRLGVCDVLSSDITLSSSGLEMLPPGEREFALKNVLAPVMDYYDYVIIDTPPALNLLTINAYTVSDFLIIPMNADILSLVGLSQLRETIESVRHSVNKNLKVLGILLNKFNPRTRLSQDVLEMAESLAQQIGTKVFDTKIRNGVAIAEAPAHGKDIFSYNPKAKAVMDYQSFIDEIAGDIKLEGVTDLGKKNEQQ